MPRTEILYDMAIFVDAAKTNNFDRAAKSLHIPVTSLKRSVARLEKVVGRRLVDCSGGDWFALTLHGKAYLRKAIELIAEAERVVVLDIWPDSNARPEQIPLDEKHTAVFDADSVDTKAERAHGAAASIEAEEMDLQRDLDRCSDTILAELRALNDHLESRL